MYTLITDATPRGDQHHIESTCFDLILGVYEKALAAGHETDYGKIHDGLSWVDVLCTIPQIDGLLQDAVREVDRAWMRQPLQKAA